MYNCADDSAAFQDAWHDTPAGGMMVIEHIEEASVSLQKTVARTLATATLARGSVRMVATTRRDLAIEVLESRMQADLFFRLRVYSVEIAPLRERKEDLGILVRGILEEITKNRGIDTPELTAEALDAAAAYHWPGNIRQLRNELIRCVSRGTHTIGKSLLLEGLETRIPPQPTRLDSAGMGLRERVDAYEKKMIDEALTRTYGNRDRAATLLGITRRTLQRKLVYHRQIAAAGPIIKNPGGSLANPGLANGMQQNAFEQGMTGDGRQIAGEMVESVVGEGEEGLSIEME